MQGTTDNFEREVVESEIPVILDFWAPWCGPCRAVTPILEELAEKHEGKIKLVKVNVDEEPALAQAFNIRSIPTLVSMRDDSILDVQVGAPGRPHLEEMFDKAVSETGADEVL